MAKFLLTFQVATVNPTTTDQVNFILDPLFQFGWTLEAPTMARADQLGNFLDRLLTPFPERPFVVRYLNAVLTP